MAAPAYITPDQIKDTLTLAGTSYADQDAARAVNAASRAIDELCNRRFYQDPDSAQARYYTPDSPVLLEIDDLVQITSVQSDDNGDGTFENTWTLNTDYLLEPFNAPADLEPQPYRWIRAHPLGHFTLPPWPRSVQVTGMFGWPEIPATIEQATLLIAVRLLTVVRSAPLGIIAFEGGAIRIARADPTVMQLIGDYITHRSAAA
jgi:hypothetical protein